MQGIKESIMKRFVLSLFIAFIAIASVSAESILDDLFSAADAVASDTARILDEDGDLLIAGVSYDGRFIKLGDLFADLTANRLAGHGGFRPRVVKHYTSLQYRPDQAKWFMSAALYQIENRFLLNVFLENDERQIKGWEIILEGDGMNDLLTPSLLQTAGSWDAFEPNNSISEASAVQLPLVDVPMSLSSGDEDWFAIDVPEGANTLFLEAKTGGMMDTYMELYAPGETDWARVEDDDTDGSNALIQYPLNESGTWYLMVRGYSSEEEGDYTLSVGLEERTLGPDEPDEGTDDAGELGIGEEPLSKRIDYANDEDWFRIDLDRPLLRDEVLRIETFGGMDLMLTLLDEYEGHILDDDDSGEDNNAMIMAGSLEAGIYYAIVSSYSGESGPYQIAASITIPVKDEFENDNSMISASEIEVDGERQQRNFSPIGDEDWVAFTVDSQGTYVMETAGNIDTYMELYDEDGVMMEENDDSDVDSNARIEKSLPPGRYIMHITPYGSASPDETYFLSVESSGK